MTSKEAIKKLDEFMEETGEDYILESGLEYEDLFLF